MFAPCAGDIGGVPREDLGVPPTSDLSRSGRERSKGANTVTPSWGASVPFEVSASHDKSSSFQASSFATQHTQEHRSESGLPTQQLNPMAQQHALTPMEQRRAMSRAKLRQLGAQHQIASGFPGENLADTARPISPHEELKERAAAEEIYANHHHESPDLVDFDDGISAISSHTLEEMEKRRQVKEKKNKNVLRLHPRDFSQIIDENAELECGDNGLQGVGILEETSEEKNTEVVFGDPFYGKDLFQNVCSIEDSHDNKRLDTPASNLNRSTSTKSQRTQNTTITEESNEFEEMYMRHEAMYWTDQDQVAHSETNARSTRCRPSERMSIEERARRLRELSRSRSRSDGTGSSNKSGASSLVSGQHPHDTVPVYSSDLFPRRRKSSSSRSRRSQSGSKSAPKVVLPLVEDSDPFSSLDHGEI